MKNVYYLFYAMIRRFVRGAFRLLISLVIVFGLEVSSVEQSLADEKGNDIFTVITMGSEQPLTHSSDDYYYSVRYEYSNFSANNSDDSFWTGVRSFFVDKDQEIVFQVQQDVLVGGESLIKASNVLGIFKNDSEIISSEVKYGERMIPPRRFQNADSVRIRVSLSEVTKERASVLRSVLGSIEKDIPLVNTFTSGSLSTASQVIDVITGMTAGANVKKKAGTFTIHGTDELAKLGYIAIVATGEKTKFEALVKEPKNIPKNVDELNNVVDKSKLPSYVLLKIVKHRYLYSPDQILSINSGIRPLIQNEIDAVKNAEDNNAKAKQCVQLRSALNYLGPVTSLDEGYAAMAALKQAKYNPDDSAAHQNEGCLTYEEINQAKLKFKTFKFGRCISASCRVANQFVNLWIDNEESLVSTKQMTWSSFLGGKIVKGSGTEAALRKNIALELKWGDIKAKDESHYSVLGVVFGTKNDSNCTYNVKVDLSMKKIGEKWKVKSVKVFETKELLHGEPASIIYKPGTPDCS